MESVPFGVLSLTGLGLASLAYGYYKYARKLSSIVHAVDGTDAPTRHELLVRLSDASIIPNAQLERIGLMRLPRAYMKLYGRAVPLDFTVKHVVQLSLAVRWPVRRLCISTLNPVGSRLNHDHGGPGCSLVSGAA